MRMPFGASESSPPSDITPEEKSNDKLTGEQEENSQVVAHTKSEQAAEHARTSIPRVQGVPWWL